MSAPLIDSLTLAVNGNPSDLPLRLHLVELLLGAGRRSEAVAHLGVALQQDPQHAQAQTLMARALGAAPTESAAPTTPTSPPAGTEAAQERPAEEVDWDSLEEEFADSVPPRFVSSTDKPEPVRGDADGIVEVERTTVTLADVGGMEDVKKRLELAFLAPMRDPKLRALFGKSLRGGLLLYGPPGCGKTFLARAVAGEMGAKFITVSLIDVLNMWFGQSEHNLHEIFEAARRNAPCVLFLDEVDALGYKRSQMQSSGMRTIGNQLLSELDGLDGNNEGVFVLAATNAPWDLDGALRRPGRFDRTVLVVPPDAPARSAILSYHLRDRPIAGIDMQKLVAATEMFSGADLAHLCESAAELAMYDSIQSGQIRMIDQRDFDAALRDVKPTTGAWLTAARNVAMFSNENGAYDDLATYLKRNKIL